MYLDVDPQVTRPSGSGWAALLGELEKFGFVEGRNLTLHRHFYDSSAEPNRISQALKDVNPHVVIATIKTSLGMQGSVLSRREP
jgi:hypothetical protein